MIFVGKNEVKNMQSTNGTRFQCRTAQEHQHIRLLEVNLNNNIPIIFYEVE